MTSEFIYEFMYMKNIVKSYLKLCVPRFQKEDSDSVSFISKVVSACKCKVCNI